MEHLPIPHGAELGEDDMVPFVCSETFEHDPYDGGPFLSYPERVQKSSLVSDINDGLTTYLNSRFSLPFEGLEAFIQTWLFFGLLHEVLQGSYHAKDFVHVYSPPDDDLNGKRFRITTTKLPKLVEDWFADRKGGATDQRLCQHLGSCLKQATQVLRAASKTSSASIRMCIGSVIDLLSVTLTEVPDSEHWLILPAFIIEDTSRLAHMQKLGWCPRELSDFYDNWGTIPTFHFLSHLDRWVLNRSHDGCTAHACEALSGSTSNYGKHDTNCDGCCEDIIIRDEDLTAILEEGNIPVLKIGVDESTAKCAISLLPASDSVRYVAISHVWIDGLGNPQGNWLPNCQMANIARWVQKVPLKHLTEMTEETLIWIDTLCCPSSTFSRGKTLALTRMQETYKNAAAVLVLDSGLQSLDCQNMTGLEICARVLTASWTTRLWTLQEGTLAKRLWAQFNDKAVDLDAAFRDVLLVHRTRMCERRIAIEISGAFSFLRSFQHAALQGQEVHVMCRTIRDRSVTVAADEPLCIATLMSLPAKHIAELPAEERMPQVWRYLASETPGIPQYVLFLERPKLSQKGFGWAPRTLLREDSISEIFDRLPGQVSFYGDLCDEGLKVQCPGGFLRMAPRPGGMLRDPWGLELKRHHMVYFRHDSGAWYALSYRGTERLRIQDWKTFILEAAQSSTQPLALIWDHPFGLGTDRSTNPLQTRLGLLATLSREPSSIMYIRFLQRVQVGLVERAFLPLLEAAHEAARNLHEDEVSRRLRDTSDGLELGDDNESQAHQAAMSDLRKKFTVVADNIKDRLGLLDQQERSKEALMARLAEDFVTHFYLGWYGFMDALFPATQCWCVD